MNPARRTLDPRAKLYLLLVANLMLFFHVGLATQIVMVVLFLLPAVLLVLDKVIIHTTLKVNAKN